MVASFYAPIQFPPSPILCFKENPDTTLRLVANGILLSCNPDRVILKRVVLSGHPLKVIDVFILSCKKKKNILKCKKNTFNIEIINLYDKLNLLKCFEGKNTFIIHKIDPVEAMNFIT